MKKKFYLWYHYRDFVPLNKGIYRLNVFPYIGKMLVLFGILIALIGFLLIFAGKIPWLGRLPGDLAIRKGNFIIFFPIVTCLVISIILTLIFYLLRK